MKIAVVTDDQQTVSRHFGRAPYYLVFTVENGAIVSRELGIPCVIGTKKASRVLKDGDWVEVDAKQGIVRLLKED